MNKEITISLPEELFNKLEAKKENLRKKNIENLNRTTTFIDPESLKLVSQMIGLYAEKGINKYEAVVQEAVKDLGDWVKPYVKKAWKEREKSKQEAINQNGNDEGIDQLPDKSNKESVKLIKEVNNMRKIFISTRWKAIYLIWFGIHLCLFLFSGNFFSNKYSNKHYIDQFYPFGTYKNTAYGTGFQGYFVIEVYDITEFVFYLTIPLLIYFVIKLWKKRENH